MGQIVEMHGDPHARTQMLIPWYVNGTLDEAEAAMVRAHAAECADCNAEIEEERILAQGVAGLALNPDHGWEKMRARIAAAPEPVTSSATVVRPAWWRRPVAAGWMAVPLAAAAAISGIMLVRPGPEMAPGAAPAYRALGSAETRGTGNAIVIFRPDASTSATQVALKASGARIVDGPLATGAYLVRVPDERRTAALGTLRASGVAITAEPIDAGPQ